MASENMVLPRVEVLYVGNPNGELGEFKNYCESNEIHITTSGRVRSLRPYIPRGEGCAGNVLVLLNGGDGYIPEKAIEVIQKILDQSSGLEATSSERA